ncbi:MAG: galactosyltransferase-related protein [Planctomycetota bacterium]
MDAGVLQLHIFQHDSAYEPMRLAEGESIEPSLTRNSEIKSSQSATLIIPTFYNNTLKANALEHLLDGIAQSQCIQEVVLVSADGNTEPLERYVQEHPSVSIQLITCDPDRRAQARNRGVEAATHEALFFVDDDMLLQDWRLADVVLSQMLEHNFDVALFPRRQFAKFPMLYEKEHLSEFVQSWREDKLESPHPQFLDPIREGSPFKTMSFCFPGCFMAIFKKAYDRIGGFPEEFSGWGFEDSDFAMRAVRQLRVMNLFRETPALLHIDHPVSPYKSEEYQKNLKQFFEDYNPLDMDWLCRKVFEGEHFTPERELQEVNTEYYSPLETVLEEYPLPIANDSVRQNYQHVIEVRTKRGLDPMPSYILLTGSRGMDEHQDGADHDLLFLYRGGAYAEHFVGVSEGGEGVEIEYASLGKFEEIAAVPVANPMRAPMELAKLAGAKMIWGEEEGFQDYRNQILDVAVRVGLPVWLLYGIGMRLNESNFAGMLSPFFRAIRRILMVQDSEVSRISVEAKAAASIQDVEEPTGAPLSSQTNDNIELIPLLNPAAPLGELVTATRAILDRDLEDWRIDMRYDKRVFAVQAPEIWHALLHILKEE